MNTTSTEAKAIASYKKHGFSRQQLAACLTNLFHISPDLHDMLDEYQILFWEGRFTAKQIQENNGAILRLDKRKENMIRYNVIYSFCTPETVKRARQVKLSFRKAKDEFGIPAYVIIRLAD